MGSFINRLRIRKNVVQENLVLFSIPLTSWKKKGDLLELPTSPDGTNLALIAGAFGTASPILQGNTAVNNSYTEYARALYHLPECYVAGQSITFRIHGKFSNAPTVSGTIDLIVHKTDDEAGIGADICATAVQSMTTSYADYDFTITPTGMIVGDLLDMELILLNDDTGGSIPAKNSFLGATKMLLDIKG